MFYFADQTYEEKFRYYCIPLPNLMLEFLSDRGLNIFCLSKDVSKAASMVYDLLRVEEKPLENLPSVMPHEHPHYNPGTRTIILPFWTLDNPNHNVVLHELGHALDYLYFGGDRLVSNTKTVAHYLRKIPPLDDHCLEQDTRNNSNVEQFATCFEAFFNERMPGEKHDGLYHTIHELDQGFVKVMNKYFVDPFKGDKLVYREAKGNV